MARVPKIKLKVNLAEMFDGAVPDNRAFREAVGGAIIERIKNRTQSNKDVNGSSFKAYSQAYKDSLNFKAFGKSNNVDLTLTGDMLGTMEILEQTSQTITIGWSDETQNAKAFNHNVGDTLPKRNFFGKQKDGGAYALSEIDKESIVNEFGDIVDNFRETFSTRSKEEFQTRSLNLLNKILGGEDAG